MDPADSKLRESYARTYYELRRHKGISEEMAFDIVADVAYFGTLTVHRGEADGLVSGAVHTTAHTPKKNGRSPSRAWQPCCRLGSVREKLHGRETGKNGMNDSI